MKRVLVVEDNKDHLRLLTYALRRQGYEVLAAEDGETGLVMAITERPFFIVMDIHLPGMDGIEAARRIRATECGRVPIVAITAYARNGDRKRILEAGCNACFDKPIDPLDIVEKIHGALGMAP